MKIASVTFKAIPRMPGVRPGDLCTIDVDKPGDALKGWRLAVRGQQVFFISPPGWVRDRNDKKRNEKGTVTVIEVPRAEVVFHWEGESSELELILKGGKYDSDPFGWLPPGLMPEKPILAQVPAGQLGDA